MTARDLSHAHLGACGGEHSKACDMLTVEFGWLFQEVKNLHLLLGRWMVWASGVAFKSDDGERLVADTDGILASPAPGDGKPAQPVEEET